MPPSSLQVASLGRRHSRELAVPRTSGKLADIIQAPQGPPPPPPPPPLPPTPPSGQPRRQSQTLVVPTPEQLRRQPQTLVAPPTPLPGQPRRQSQTLLVKHQRRATMASDTPPRTVTPVDRSSSGSTLSLPTTWDVTESSVTYVKPQLGLSTRGKRSLGGCKKPMSASLFRSPPLLTKTLHQPPSPGKKVGVESQKRKSSRRHSSPHSRKSSTKHKLISRRI